MALSTEHGFAYWLTTGTILWGWTLSEQGQGAEGMLQVRQGLAAYRATGAELARPYWLALLAETHAKVGQTEAGLAALAEALAVVDKHGERFYAAELYRLKGELLLMQASGVGWQPAPMKTSRVSEAEPPELTQVESCFRQALEVARRQRAKLLELRAAMSLSRLWMSQGKRDEARQLLAEIYGWFTEGFDTPDLQEAKALLEATSEA